MKRWLNRVINIGVNNELSFDEKRRTRVLNLVAFLSFFSTSYFLMENLLTGRYLLVSLNAISIISMAAIIIANHFRSYHTGQVIVSILMSVMFSVSGLFYHTNMEYYLLIVNAMVITGMQQRKTQIIICSVNCIAFVLILFYGHKIQFFEPVPELRRISNMLIWLLFYIIFIIYFRQQNSSYRREIEDKNLQLENQQATLLNQTKQLEQSNRQLLALNNTKEKLFSIVAHDVRSPVSALKTSLDLLHHSELSKEEFGYLTKSISGQLAELQNSLDNLLQWSHGQMKGMEINTETVILEPLVTDTLNLLKPNLTNKYITTNLSGDDQLAIQADPNHIKLVMRNLINNAIKFSYSGSSIELAIKKTGSCVLFSVADKGMGIKPETMKKLFSGVSVASTRGTTNEKGTGIGLILSKEFAEKNGCDILVESEPGKGSKFTLVMPSA